MSRCEKMVRVWWCTVVTEVLLLIVVLRATSILCVVATLNWIVVGDHKGGSSLRAAATRTSRGVHSKPMRRTFRR